MYSALKEEIDELDRLEEARSQRILIEFVLVKAAKPRAKAVSSRVKGMVVGVLAGMISPLILVRRKSILWLRLRRGRWCLYEFGKDVLYFYQAGGVNNLPVFDLLIAVDVQLEAAMMLIGYCYEKCLSSRQSQGHTSPDLDLRRAQGQISDQTR